MTDDIRVQAIIALGVDEATAKRIVTATDATTKGLKSTQEQAKQVETSLRMVAREAERLRGIGTVIAASGAGILAPFILTAKEYADRFKGLEKNADAYAAAQQRITDASTNFGRQASVAVIPIMNQIADVQDRVAQFAADHPDLVKAAITGGGALVAAGGALVLAGTAISTIARSAELLERIAGTGVGDAAGSIAKVAGGIALFGATLDVTTRLVQAFGKASGDQYLATFDPLKTLREGIVAAIVWFEKLVAQGAISFDSFFDKMGTGISQALTSIRDGLGKFINGLLEFVAGLARQFGLNDLSSGLLGARDKNAMATAVKVKNGVGAEYTGPSAYQQQAASAGGDFQMREAARNLASTQADKNINASTAGLINFAQTGSLGSLADGIVSGIKGLFSGGTSGGAGSATGIASPEGVKAYIEYSQKLKDMDKTDKQALLDLKKNFDSTETKAETDKQNQIDKVNADYMKQSLKDVESFQATEEKEQKASNKARIRLLQDLHDNLFAAAASNDVVAFLNAQRAGNKQLDQQKQDAEDADKQRIADFQKQQKENQASRQDQIDSINKTAKDAHDARLSDYRTQRADLITKQAQERALLQQNFAIQLSQLAGNLGGLTTLQENYYARMTVEFDNYLKTNQKALQQAVLDSQGGGGKATSGRTTYTAPTGTLTANGYLPFTIPQFASGGVKQGDGLAYLHDKEVIYNPRSGGIPGGVTVDMRGAMLTGGATQDDLVQVQRATYRGVLAALQAGGA